MLSLILGPIVGLIGSSVSGYFKLQEKKQEMELRKMDNAHELVLLDRQMEMKGAELENEQLLAEISADAKAMTGSYAHDATFAQGETYDWVLAVQKLTRPALTVLAMIIAAVVVFSIIGDLGKSEVMDLAYKVIGLSEATFVWWFADSRKRNR